MIKFEEAQQEIRNAWEDVFCLGCEHYADGECGCKAECFEYHQITEPEEFLDVISDGIQKST